VTVVRKCPSAGAFSRVYSWPRPMNPKLLIDAIVKQTTVLIAQLSTTAGIRAPLATIADQVFVELAREIEGQGVSRKVAADMFGLALRTYQAKVRRLEESVTERGASLWEAVLQYVEENQGVDRRSLLARFVADDPQSIGAVLKDLCDSGLLYRTGSGAAARFRAVPEEERQEALRAHDKEALASLVRVAIYRGASSEDELVRSLGASPESVSEALQQLERDGALEREDGGGLRTVGVVIPTGASVGWEAAVFDHFQAMVTALTRKLAQGAPRSLPADSTGGATLSFELSEGHPHRDEVHGLLQKVRTDLNELWQRVGEYNQARARESEDGAREARDPDEVVTFYFGQSIQSGKGS